MKPRDLEKWMDDLGLTKSEVFRVLGIARSTLDRYLSGETPIPRVVSLACAAVVSGLEPYPSEPLSAAGATRPRREAAVARKGKAS